MQKTAVSRETAAEKQHFSTILVFATSKQAKPFARRSCGRQLNTTMQNFIFSQTNIQLSPQMVQQLQTYCNFLLEENQKYNLTAITEPAAVWQKHFADSILGAVLLPQNASLCDVGCGAGFPSVPLKIARPDLCVTLVDSLEKRIAFCRALCSKIGVEANFFHSRAEDFAKTHSEAFDVAVARAVAPLPILLEYTAQLVRLGGFVLAYKTPEEPLCPNVCNLLGLSLGKTQNFVLPDGSRRTLLRFDKVAHTPPKFPRGQNKPRKAPLS